MTSKWLLPLVYYFQDYIKDALKDVTVIGTALGDAKHKISQDRFLFVCSYQGMYDYNKLEFVDSVKNIKNFDLAIEKLSAKYEDVQVYSFYHTDNLIKVISIELDALLPRIVSGCILDSKYSELLETPIDNNVFPFIYNEDIVDIIYKNKKAANKYIEYLAARIGCLIEDIDLTNSEYEQTFQLKNEMLYCNTEVGEFNIDELVKDNIKQLKKDIKTVLKNRYDIDDKVLLYGIHVEVEILESILKNYT